MKCGGSRVAICLIVLVMFGIAAYLIGASRGTVATGQDARSTHAERVDRAIEETQRNLGR